MDGEICKAGKRVGEWAGISNIPCPLDSPFFRLLKLCMCSPITKKFAKYAFTAPINCELDNFKLVDSVP